MLVPMELCILVMHKGYLSPSFALGWRIGDYVREYFENLEDVRIVARNSGDATLVLEMMCQKNKFSFPVTLAGAEKPWDFLFYHSLTGTALMITAVPSRVELSCDTDELEHCFTSNNTDRVDAAVKQYQRALDALIVRILNDPLESYCRIIETRLRFLGLNKDETSKKTMCHRCGRLFVVSKLVDSDGEICCIHCADLEPSWFEWI